MTADSSRWNWSHTHRYTARRLLRPTTADELAAMVTASAAIKPLGTAHSFSDVADTTGDQVTVADLPRRVEIDRTAGTATVSAGLRYAEIAPEIQAAGFALPALASLPHVSVAGACATATHGSGIGIGNLSSQVSALEFVDGLGRVRRLDRRTDPERFPGAVVGLGALGLVTAVTLDLVPTFDIAQRVFLDLPAARLTDRLHEIFSAAYSVSCFTRWRADTVDQVWFKALAADPPPPEDLLAGAREAPGDVHPVPGAEAGPCTPQGGQPGPWHERLPHFRAGFLPSFGDEIQTEFFVDVAAAPDAIRALIGVGERIDAALRVSEIRYVAGDDLWLSPAYGRDVVALHFTWTSDIPVVLAAVGEVERTLAPFDPVPHWGKVFTLDPATFVHRYPRLADFASLAREYDPDLRFQGALTKRLTALAGGRGR